MAITVDLPRRALGATGTGLHLPLPAAGALPRSAARDPFLPRCMASLRHDVTRTEVRWDTGPPSECLAAPNYEALVPRPSCAPPEARARLPDRPGWRGLQRGDADHLIRQVLLLAPGVRLLVAVAGAEVLELVALPLGDGAQVPVGAGTRVPTEQGAGRALHLVDGQVTGIGDFVFCRRHELWVPRVSSQALRYQDLRGREADGYTHSKAQGGAQPRP